MKKKTLKNALVKIIVVLLIVLVSLISFLGIHKRNLNKWKNILPEYQFGKELSEIRTFTFTVDDSMKSENTTDNTTSSENTTENTVSNTTETNTVEDTTATTTDTNTTNTANTTENAVETPVNDPSALTAENYKKVKKIAEKRLTAYGISDANVSVNEKDGTLAISVPYEEQTDYVANLGTQAGDVQIIDSDSKEVLMDKKMIKKASVYYKQADTDTNSTTASDEVTYNLGVRLTFTSEGQKKFNELSKTYIETTDENGKSSQKTITVQIDGEDKYKTYFTADGEYTDLAVLLYRNVSPSDTETVNKDYRDCIAIETAINNETLPVKYKLTSGSFIESNLSENFIKYLTIAGIILLVIAVILTIVKNKKTGIFMSLIEIGYIAILLLIIRSASVSLTFAGMLTIPFMALANYLLLNDLKTKEKVIDKLESFGKFILTIIPFIITTIVFALGKEANIQSIGSVGIWGIFTFVYTLITSIFLLDGKKAKKNGVE